MVDPAVRADDVFWLYIQQEGSTQGGTLHGLQVSHARRGVRRLPAEGHVAVQAAVRPATGRETATSPQGNQGLFSHNFNNVNQTYAYDFSLDEGEGDPRRPRRDRGRRSPRASPNRQPGHLEGSATRAAEERDRRTAREPERDRSRLGASRRFQPGGSLLLGSKDIAYYTSISGNMFQGVTGTEARRRTRPAPATRSSQIDLRLELHRDQARRRRDARRRGRRTRTTSVYGGGPPIVTVAVYGHGLPGSITEAFASHQPAGADRRRSSARR